MTQIKDILTQPTVPGEGEHLGPDGLIHCDNCGGKRQTVLEQMNPPRTVRCLCPCQVAERDSRKEDLRRQEELIRFQRMRAAAMQDTALLKCTFEASGFDSSALQAARKYVQQWPRMQEAGMGLLLWGSVGTGKTYIAACIANALLEQKVPVLLTSFGRILGSLPGPTSGEQTAAIDRWMQCALLIIDDLGVERETPYTTELVYHIIDARYRSGKPMVITTNLTMEELENPDTREKMRIYDRVLERCTPVRVEGEHIRGKKRKENRALARKQLT